MFVAPVQCWTLVVEGGRNRPGAKFIAIEDVHEQLTTEHSEGAICLQIGSRVLLDERHWDPIDLLWLELIETCTCVSQRRSYLFHFPDQPLEFSAEFVERSESVAVSVGGERPAVTSRIEFLEKMVQAGMAAVTTLRRIVPRGESRFHPHMSELCTLQEGLRRGV